MDVVARWPGSVHDSTIFDNSHLRALFETGRSDGYLIGDGGYACRPYMLTLLTNPITAAEQSYNAAHVCARNCIERTNGMLKRRFPCLKYGMRLNLDNTQAVIVATVVLHNIAIMTRDAEAEDDQELSDFNQPTSSMPGPACLAWLHPVFRAYKPISGEVHRSRKQAHL